MLHRLLSFWDPCHRQISRLPPHLASPASSSRFCTHPYIVHCRHCSHYLPSSTSLPILSQLPRIKTRELHIARQAAAYLIFPYSFSKSLEPLQEHTMPIHRHVVRRRLPCHFLGFILILTYLASLLVSFLYDKCFGKPLTSPLTDKIFPVMYGYGGMLVLENICFTRQIVYFRRYGWRTMLNYYTQYTFVCFFMPTRRYEIPCLDCIHLGHTCPRCAQLQGD